MRRLFTGIFLLTMLSQANTQDLALAPPNGSILAPVSGCGMSATETVTVRVFNFGPTLLAGSTFDVTYILDGGAPVTETVTLAANLTTNSTYTYSFTATANLSVAGAHNIDASVALLGDINAANDAYNGYAVTNTSPSVGGTVNSSTNVCDGNNSGALTLTGNTGNVVNWEYSTDGGTTWFNISNTTTSQSYTNITIDTWYRANVQNGTCPTASSTIAILTIDPPTVGGTLSGPTTACISGNSGTHTLSGHTGTVDHWEYSTDGGVTWNTIINTTTTNTYTNIVVTTRYRAYVISGSCPGAYSSQRIVTVNPLSVGGTLSPTADTVCNGSNSGTITLSGHTGSVTRWEQSPDGVTWTNITNTTTTQNYLNLTTTTYYRVRVTSGACPAAYSSRDTIMVVSTSNGGAVASSDTICSGAVDTLILGGHFGSVLNWEYSDDGGANWSNIANTTDTNVVSGITETRMYRAQVQSGSCTAAYSIPATLTVDSSSVGGTLYGSATVCASGNAGTLTLIGHNSVITNWESSTDGGTTWGSIANTTPFENYNNLTQTTDYRVIVYNGVCPNDTSSMATIVVDSASVGGSVTADDTVCAGANGDTLALSGYTGSILSWEMSNDGGVTWITLSNTSNSQAYINLMTTTSYRASIKSGVCPATTSTPATIQVDAQSEGGIMNSNAQGCEGNNSGVMNLTGYTGSILTWLSSTDGGATWSLVPDTLDFYNYVNLTDTTMFSAIVQSGNCTADTAVSSTITILPAPSVSFTSDTLICLGETISFTNLSTISSGFITAYIWDFGDGNTDIVGNPDHIYADTGTYVVTLVASSNFGCLDTAMVNTVVNPVPDATISASGPLSFCVGDTLWLSVPFANDVTYLWNDVAASTNDTIMADSSMNYLVIATDTLNGCSARDSVDVIVFPVVIADAGVDTTVSLGSAVMLNGSGGVSYSWQTSVGLDNPFTANPMASPLVTTDYELTVTDGNGCTDIDSVTVTVEEDFQFTIPNLITPNEDGFNDVWVIGNILNYPDNTVTIFNRNGQVVYKMDSYNNLWDGTYNGSKLPDGTYYYVITFTDSDESVKGAVNIIRSSK